MLPLLFVLFVTAVKDAYEDYRRYKSDRDMNSRPCKRIRSDDTTDDVTEIETAVEVETITWADLSVGDLAVVQRDEAIPADILVLASSGESGVCYISSMNLDGETNLKLRRSLISQSSTHSNDR